MIRTVFVIIWTVMATVFFSFLAILASLLDKKGEAPHLVARVWGRSLLFAAGVKVTVENPDNIDPSRSYIYMSNHQSNFDIPVLLAYLPVQFRWLAKVELFRIPIFGFAMQRAGYISIDRSDRKAAILSLKRAAEIIRGGVSVLIFPEGTRSRDGNIRPFKSGGFILAIDSGVPIVPVIVHGTWPIMPKDRLRVRPGNVVLEIREPVETSPYSRSDKAALLDKIRGIITESHEKGKNLIE
ncbi:MAG: lysophospholipid acyltransferase family protein [Thermodesulfobacteriota bacterium]